MNVTCQIIFHPKFPKSFLQPVALILYGITKKSYRNGNINSKLSIVFYNIYLI